MQIFTSPSKICYRKQGDSTLNLSSIMLNAFGLTEPNYNLHFIRNREITLKRMKETLKGKDHVLEIQKRLQHVYNCLVPPPLAQIIPLYMFGKVESVYETLTSYFELAKVAELFWILHLHKLPEEEQVGESFAQHLWNNDTVFCNFENVKTVEEYLKTFDSPIQKMIQKFVLKQHCFSQNHLRQVTCQTN